MAAEDKKTPDESADNGGKAAAEAKSKEPGDGVTGVAGTKEGELLDEEIKVEESDDAFLKEQEAARREEYVGEEEAGGEEKDTAKKEAAEKKAAEKKKAEASATSEEKGEEKGGEAGEEGDEFADLIREDDPKGVQERINEIIHKFRDSERTLKETQDELAKVRREQVATSKSESDTSEKDEGDKEEEPEMSEYGFPLDPNDPEPNEENYQDPDTGYTDYVKALNKWVITNNNKFLESQRQAAQQQTEQDAEREVIEKKMDVGRQAHADFDRVLEAADSTIFTPDMRVAIMKTGAPAEVAYQLAKNPEAARRIASLRDPAAEMVEVALFSATLSSPGDTSTETDTSKETGKKKDESENLSEEDNDSSPGKKAPEAPEPIESLGGRERQGKSMANMTQAEYEKTMETQDA